MACWCYFAVVAYGLGFSTIGFSQSMRPESIDKLAGTDEEHTDEQVADDVSIEVDEAASKGNAKTNERWWAGQHEHDLQEINGWNGDLICIENVACEHQPHCCPPEPIEATAEECEDVQPPTYWNKPTCETQYLYTDNCAKRRDGTMNDGKCYKTCGVCKVSDVTVVVAPEKVGAGLCNQYKHIGSDMSPWACLEAARTNSNCKNKTEVTHGSGNGIGGQYKNWCFCDTVEECSKFTHEKADAFVRIQYASFEGIVFKGLANKNKCPRGSIKIENEQVCKEISGNGGLPEYTSSGRFGHAPSHCFTYGSQIRYNTHPDGDRNGNDSPMCLRKAHSTQLVAAMAEQQPQQPQQPDAVWSVRPLLATFVPVIFASVAIA